MCLFTLITALLALAGISTPFAWWVRRRSKNKPSVKSDSKVPANLARPLPKS